MDVATVLQTKKIFVGKVSRLFRNFPAGLESFQTVRKPSTLSVNFPHCQETFQTIWKLSRPSANFPDRLESFWKVWKLSRQIFYCLQYCCNIHILHFCKKSFDTLACVLRKQFTHSVRKDFAHEILPTGKFWLFVSLASPEVFLTYLVGPPRTDKIPSL